MANVIDSLSYGGNTYAFTLPYGSCSTAASTAAKVVTVSNFALETGARIAVKFTVTNTASSPTLNVNGTGAKAIYYRGAAISAGYLAANRTHEFVYNGTQWELIGDLDTNTTYSLSSFGLTATATELNYCDGVTSNIQTQLNGKLPLSGGTVTGSLTVNGALTGSLTGNASSATKLTTARTIRTNLASTSTASFDGSANITPGVTGTLPVSNGGTGATTFTSGAALIGNGTGAIATRSITNNTSATYISASSNLTTANTLAYWNGAYNSSGSSNLAYCSKGAFGTAATKDIGYFATVSHTHNYAGSDSAGGSANSTKGTLSINIDNGSDGSYTTSSFNGSKDVEFTAAGIYHYHKDLRRKGVNTISSTTNDTVANWGAQNISVHNYNTTGLLNGQPSQYGFLLNLSNGVTEVKQLWFTSPNGDISHRGGNSAGWSNSWRTILDSSNYGTQLAGGTINGNLTTTGCLYCSNWFCSYGATGWYNETYSGGIYMTDSKWVETSHSKGFRSNSGFVGGLSETSPYKCQFRAYFSSSTPSFMIRNDGTNTYFLLTNSSTPYDSWNSLRPFWINNTTGAVTMQNGLTVNNSSLIVSNGQYYRSESGAVECQYNVLNSKRNGRFVASAAGNLGIYDVTNSQWVICSDTTNNVSIPSTLSVVGGILLESGNYRKPAGSSNVDGNKCAVLKTQVNSSGTYYFTLSGQWGTAGASFTNKTFTATTSDIRLKENIIDTKIKALPLINQIKIREFDWKDSGTHQKIGFVADELELLDSGLSIGGGYDEDGNIDAKGVNEFYLVGYLTKGIQELSQENQSLREENQSLKEDIKAIKEALGIA